MKRALLALALALPATLFSGCLESKSCTAIGCADQASLLIRRADGGKPQVAVELEIDGRNVACTVPDESGVVPACGDAQVQVSVRELQDCKEVASGQTRSLQCTGTGRFEQVVTVMGQPHSLRLTLRKDGAVVTARTFQPAYQESRPNGPDCEPVCHQWSETWLLP